MKAKYRAKRIHSGRYQYRGVIIHCVGYYEPEHRICWEAIDKDGCGFAHAYTFRDCKYFVDKDLDKIENLI